VPTPGPLFCAGVFGNIWPELRVETTRLAARQLSLPLSKDAEILEMFEVIEILKSLELIISRNLAIGGGIFLISAEFCRGSTFLAT
jgi:hypothetical protein